MIRTVDASRFLQQSTNAHLSFTNQDDRPLDRRRMQSNSRYVQRPNGMHQTTPYQNNPSSSQTRFPFASRLAGRQSEQQQAPLFYSAAEDGFQEEDEGDEHEREVADFYALQRSRQHFGA